MLPKRWPEPEDLALTAVSSDLEGPSRMASARRRPLRAKQPARRAVCLERSGRTSRLDLVRIDGLTRTAPRG